MLPLAALLLLILGFLAGVIRLLGYCLTNRRVRLRLFLAAWFLGLSVLFLRAAWISFTIERHGDSFGEAVARAVLGDLSFGGAIGFGVLALAYFTPTIWRALQPRRPESSPGVAPPDTTGHMHWPEALLFTVIVLPLLGVTWLTLVYNYPALVARSQSDQPRPWLKATTNPPTLENDGRPLTWTEITLYSQSPSGKWVRIAFPDESHTRRLAVLSPDSVLITWPSSLPFNNLVGAVYKKGSEAPVATVPGSDDIAAVPSGGFTTTSCEPPPRCQDHSCRSCASLTVRRFDSLGALSTGASLPVPPDAAACDWWPVHRLMGEDLVYAVNRCPARSYGAGYYRASPNGIQRITSRILSNEYTAVEDKNEMESQTEPVNWYHIPWMPDLM